MNVTIYRISICALALALVFSIQAGIPAQSTQSPGQSAEHLRQSASGQQSSNEPQVSVIKPADFSKFSARLKQEAKSGVVVLTFWARWCSPPCQKQINDLVLLDDVYRAKGVKIVAVNLTLDDYADELKYTITFLSKSKARFDNFLIVGDDISGSGISKEWPEAKITALPSTLILNRQGNCVYFQRGLKPGELVKAIESALNP